MKKTVEYFVSSKISNLRSRKSTPENPQSNDIYIVEFPKSGITWFSTILVNAFLLKYNINSSVTFLNLRTYVPDIHLTRCISPFINGQAGIRLIKSHAEWNPHYKTVIYLSRNPVDVMKSYYRYSKNRSGMDLSFEEFVKNSRAGVHSWMRHIDSWLDRRPKGEVLHLVRYEDLMNNPTRVISELSENFGFNFNEETISESIAKASIEAMKKSESLFVKNDIRYKSGFVKSGEKIHDEATEIYIKNEAANQMAILQYI